MPRYDFGDALFHFFRIFSRRPLAVIWLGIWEIIIYTAITIGMFALAFPLFHVLIEVEASGADIDAETLMPVVASSLLALCLGSIGTILVVVSIQGAWLRLLTKEKMSAVIPFRFGGDELRLLGINIIFFIFAMVAMAVIAIVFSVFNYAVISLGSDSFSAIAGGALGNTVLGIIAFVLAVIFALRFAATPALTVLQGRFNLFGGFAASKGIVGVMFLTYLVAIGILFVAMVIIGIVQQVAILFAMTDFIAMTEYFEDFDSVESIDEFLALFQDILTRPLVMIALGIVIVTQMIYQVFSEGLWHGIGAYVARRHEGLEGPFEEDITPNEHCVGPAPNEG